MVTNYHCNHHDNMVTMAIMAVLILFAGFTRAHEFVMTLCEMGTGGPISLSTFCCCNFSWTKLILNVKVRDVFKDSGNLLHDSHKNFENPCRNC